MSLHARLLPAALLLVAGAAAAQGLGEARAAAWLGRPFEANVVLRTEGNSLYEACTKVEVNYGGRRVPDSQVRAGIQRQGEHAALHVQALQPVDDVLVTLTVRAGCGGAVERRYSFPTETLPHGLAAVPAVAAPRLPVATPMPVVPAVEAAARAVPPAATAAREPAPSTAAALVPERPPVGPGPDGGRASGPARPVATAPTPAPRATAAAVAVAVATPAPQPLPATPVAAARDPAPPALVRNAGELRLPESRAMHLSETLALPAGDPAQRANAARLWLALSAPPEEFLRLSDLSRQLGTDLASQRQGLAQAQAQLRQSRTEADTLRSRGSGPQFGWMAAAAGGGVLAGLLLVLLAQRVFPARRSGSTGDSVLRSTYADSDWSRPVSPNSIPDTLVLPDFSASEAAAALQAGMREGSPSEVAASEVPTTPVALAAEPAPPRLRVVHGGERRTG